MAVGTTSQEILQRTIDHFWETIPPVWNGCVLTCARSRPKNLIFRSNSSISCGTCEKGITSVSELAAIRQISRPAISQAINLLVEKDLLTRHQNSDDRRFVELKLTQSGNELLNAVLKIPYLDDGAALCLRQQEIDCLINAMEC